MAIPFSKYPGGYTYDTQGGIVNVKSERKRRHVRSHISRGDPRRRLGTPEDIYHDAMSSAPAPRYVAGFAPDVLRAAADGDVVASRIVQEAADEIARSIRSARIADGPIGLTGGLARSQTYVTAVRDALQRLDLAPEEFIVRPDAALDGARLVADESSSRSAFASLIAVKESE